MRSTMRRISELSLATSLLALGIAGCGSTTSTDVAYEDSYSGAYYYPATVGYAGVAAVGFGYYGVYLATPAGSALATPIIGPADGGPGGASGSGGAGGSGSTASGATTVRGAVGEAIRNIALGGSVCPGQATVTHPAGTSVCGVSGNGLDIVFNGCQLSGGGTVDGTVNVRFTLTASDTTCAPSAMVSIGYTSTLTNLVYTGTGGAKLVIPNQTDTSTINVSPGQVPATVAMMSNGEIQRIGADGTTAFDLTFTGSRTFSSISIANQTYTLDGAVSFTDKAGGTGTMTATGLQQDKSCCKPIGGTLAVTRTGGSHAGSHSWTFSSACGSAMLDGKTVTLPACL